VAYRPEIEPAEREPDLEFLVEEADREPTLLDYARVVWGGRWLILALVVVATGSAVGLSMMMPKTYIAQATLMPLGQDRAAGLSALAGSLGGALGMESPSVKLMAVLQSRTVADQVVSALDLENVLGQGKTPKPTRAMTIETFQKSVLKISASRGVIAVSAQWGDPALAAAIANASVSAAGRFLNDRSISISFQILDEAVPPSQPSGPSIRLNVAVAFVLSVFAALLVVFVRQYLRGLREPGAHRSHVPGYRSRTG
jgi:uncharacterized protein involved in exopolysaccharide biosynthesis